LKEIDPSELQLLEELGTGNFGVRDVSLHHLTFRFNFHCRYNSQKFTFMACLTWSNSGKVLVKQKWSVFVSVFIV